MKTMKFALAALVGVAATAAVAAPAANPPARPVDSTRLAAPASKDATVQRGFKLYVDTGCWQCHGYQGGGSGAGPQIAGPAFPKAAFVKQLRDPRARMPIYTAKVLPDADVEAIYAYIQTIPRAKPGADIPLIAKMP
jgi:mono/diheme cytochrome c family protein